MNHTDHDANSGDGSRNTRHSHKKHMLIMLICCLLPMAILFLVPVLKLNSGFISKVLPYLVLLLCPLGHLLMMGMMGRKSDCAQHEKQAGDSAQ